MMGFAEPSMHIAMSDNNTAYMPLTGYGSTSIPKRITTFLIVMLLLRRGPAVGIRGSRSFLCWLFVFHHKECRLGSSFYSELCYRPLYIAALFPLGFSYQESSILHHIDTKTRYAYYKNLEGLA